MFHHLPIAILAALSPVAISDKDAEVRYLEGMLLRGGSTDISDRCSKHEANALSQLETEWPQFVGPDRSSCMVEATIGGFASYVELLACLEMARDARNSK